MNYMIMNAWTYTKVRNNFAKLMDQVCNNHDPIIVTRNNKRPVVMLSLEDFESIEGTLYLLKSPKNAERLRKSIKNDKLGIRVKEKKLVTK